jgi:hypothetical protein
LESVNLESKSVKELERFIPGLKACVLGDEEAAAVGVILTLIPPL